MFGLIKKYTKFSNDNSIHEITVGTSFEENKDGGQHALQTSKLTKIVIVKNILARWLRLAFPTYIILFFSMTLFNYLGNGPCFPHENNKNLQEPLGKYWWSIVFFV